MTRFERCANCTKSSFSRQPGLLERMRLGFPSDGRVLIHCQHAVDGVVIPSEYEQICNLGCASFDDNLPPLNE